MKKKWFYSESSGYKTGSRLNEPDFDPICVNRQTLETVNSVKSVRTWQRFKVEYLCSKLVRLLKKWHVATREPILFFIICIRSILEYGSQVFSSCSTKLSKRRRTKTIQRRYMLSTFISERTCKINTLCNFHLV